MKKILLSAFLFITIFACKKECNCTEVPNPACLCDENYDPVCGCNGTTYGNACMAECNGILIYKKGECN
ncbi:MAG: hypothetical protein H6577_07995 [Lewinellaceae bacterium]|nr:hypothetical protein [Saprospiraceae bacterium]MCB9338056.1 hypothetical protein [Lewinellaceae bacterium]